MTTCVSPAVSHYNSHGLVRKAKRSEFRVYHYCLLANKIAALCDKNAKYQLTMQETVR